MNPATPSPTQKLPLYKVIAFVLCVLAYLLVKFFYHELWKDEWQAWLVARDLGWSQLFGFLYYEGHPALWYLYLKCWTLLPAATDEATILQIAHALPALAFYYLLFFRFRLPLLLCIGLFGSYLFFFEYGLINRGYIWVMLLAGFTTLMVQQPPKYPIALPLTLFALCQTEVYGLIMAGAFMLYLLLGDYLKHRQLGKLFRTKHLQSAALGLGLGLLVFVATVYPRGSSEEELSRAYLDQPFSAAVAAKAFQGSLANTYCLGLLPDTNIEGTSAFGLLLSLLVLAALCWFFWADKRLLLTFLAFTLVLYLFLISIYTGGVRQWGMAFVFFVCCLSLWMDRQGGFKPFQYAILGLFLVGQLWHCGRALLKEYRHPFSNAIYAGEFIKEKVPATVPIVAINKFEAAPVSGYAGRPFYELPDGKPFTYFKWLEKVYLPPEAELALFAKYKKTKGLIVLTHQPVDPKRYPNLRLWEQFDRYSFKNESYYLYVLERND
ncbi:MAG: hypothetical protein AAGG75_03565 [Bacteroidota bacterium]